MTSLILGGLPRFRDESVREGVGEGNELDYDYNNGNDIDGVNNEQRDDDRSRSFWSQTEYRATTHGNDSASASRYAGSLNAKPDSARASMPPSAPSRWDYERPHPQNDHHRIHDTHDPGRIDGSSERPPRTYRSSTAFAFGNDLDAHRDNPSTTAFNANAGLAASSSISASSAPLGRIPRDDRKQFGPSRSSSGQTPAPTPSSSISITQELHRMTQLLISSDTLARKTKRESEKRLENIDDALEARMTVMNDLLGEVRDLLEGEKQGREEVMVKFDSVIGRLDSLEGRLQSLQNTSGRGSPSRIARDRHDASDGGVAATHRPDSVEEGGGRSASRSRESSGYSTAREAVVSGNLDRDDYRSPSPSRSQRMTSSSFSSPSGQQILQRQARSRGGPTSQAQTQLHPGKQPTFQRDDLHDSYRQPNSSEVPAFLDFAHDAVNACTRATQADSVAALSTTSFGQPNGNAISMTLNNDFRPHQQHKMSEDIGLDFNVIDTPQDLGVGDTGGLFIDIDGDEFQPPDMNMNVEIDVNNPPRTTIAMESAGVNPRDIMRPPKAITPAPPAVLEMTSAQVEKEGEMNGSRSRNTQKLVTAANAREKRKSAAASELAHANSDGEDGAPRSKRVKHRAAAPKPTPSSVEIATDSEADLDSDSASDSEDDNKEIDKPPARRPFPSRLPAPPDNVKTSPIASQKQKCARTPKSTSNKDLSPNASNRRRSGRKFAIATATVKKSESPISIASSQSSYITKKKRTYSHSSKYTQAGTARVRKYRGAVRLAEKCLATSDGIKKTEGEWPRKGPNTARGRLEEIICDVCKGRCHWSCAGIPEEKDMTNETWICPDCTYRIEEEETDRELIDTVQQIKCIRFNCILREKRALDHEEGEEAMYFVERIVGRRCAKIDPDTGEKAYEYLVKWDGYGMDECTWEPPSNLAPHSTRLHEAFLQKVERTHSNLEAGVCVLPEAKHHWDEVTGKPKGTGSQSGDGSEREGRDGDRSDDDEENGDGGKYRDGKNENPKEGGHAGVHNNGADEAEAEAENDELEGEEDESMATGGSES
ncbi:hypothetical protein I316_01815 [Kwoniella heveanensis BCC8398]|uniref:Chromo domain-containing protein n=1 Tax=Kwoniella heveanensis BCC8398 TaxID=1296120 RepID=A0A1B9GZZ2_9TREE|nr:hypothetical protein I316_01815 [Kwoniella heveanensis BCC8398]